MKKIVFFMMCLLAMACGGNSNNGSSQNDGPDVVELKSKEFYQAMLEKFCVENFEKEYKEFRYCEGSLRVTTLSLADNHTIEIIGTLSFERKAEQKVKDFIGKIPLVQELNNLPMVEDAGRFNDRELRATIRVMDDDNYCVTLKRQSTKDSQKWKPTKDITIHFEGSY